MVGPSLGGFMVVMLVHISGAIFVTVMLAVGIAWGIRWGLTWAVKEISRAPGLERWLKRVLNSSEKSNNSNIFESSADVSNQPN